MFDLELHSYVMISYNLLGQLSRNGRKKIFSDLLKQINGKPKFLKGDIAADETWIFKFDPETKR